LGGAYPVIKPSLGRNAVDSRAKSFPANKQGNREDRYRPGFGVSGLRDLSVLFATAPAAGRDFIARGEKAVRLT
jgi:hypothetical protein